MKELLIFGAGMIVMYGVRNLWFGRKTDTPHRVIRAIDAVADSLNAIERVLTDDDTNKSLILNHKKNLLMSKTDEALAKLAAIEAQQAKVLAEVLALKAAADAADTPQSVLDAIDRVASAVQAVDDVNPDTP